MPTTIETKAAEVLGYLPPPPQGEQAVIAIGTIISIIEGLISLYECLHRRPAGAAAACRAPGLLARAKLRGEIRRHLPDADLARREDVFAAFLHMGKGVTEGDFAAMAEGN